MKNDPGLSHHRTETGGNNNADILLFHRRCVRWVGWLHSWDAMGSQVTDTALIKFRRNFGQTLRLAHGLDCNDFFLQAARELVEDLRTLATAGSVTPDQVSLLCAMLRALLDSQTRWLLGEAAVIEAVEEVRH